MRNHSYENDFDLHENETACRTHFRMRGFVLRLVLKQRHKRTRKWPIGRHGVLLPINHKNYNFREKKNSQVMKERKIRIERLTKEA